MLAFISAIYNTLSLTRSNNLMYVERNELGSTGRVLEGPRPGIPATRRVLPAEAPGRPAGQKTSKPCGNHCDRCVRCEWCEEGLKVSTLAAADELSELGQEIGL
jgi:hypothetical protein